MKECVLGYHVDVVTPRECVAQVVRHIAAGHGAAWLGCLNPHSYAISLQDEAFARALRGCNWLVPDGVGVVYASRILRGSITHRVTGSEVFQGVHESLQAEGRGRIFFLGSSSDTLQKVCKRLRREYPRLDIVGTFSPPFKESFSDEDNQNMRDAINACRPDVLWVAMTAPKQEKWIMENLPLLRVRFAGAVGAVFDFYAGNVRRSSPAFQRLGLEWLPRLIQQPNRLWRRTFVSAPLFFAHVVRERLRQRY